MVNFARIFDRRVAHIGLLCCALAFLLRTKFPHPLTIFLGGYWLPLASKLCGGREIRDFSKVFRFPFSVFRLFLYLCKDIC